MDLPETVIPRRATRPLVSPEDQRVTWVELFFDLVFVFSVTQVVGLLHGSIDALHAGQAVLVFWLVWWAWTQFTWALNAADTTHGHVELATLLATAVAFFMAIALPHAFGERGAWFAVPYVLVRVIGLVLYGRVAEADPSQHAAVRRFAAASIFGLVAVLAGGFAAIEWRYVLWGVAILLDVLAALVGARSENWNLHPEHFAERHGLFVIIALGETLIVAAAGIANVTWTSDVVSVAVMAVAVTCALWWSYFTHAKPALDHAVASVRGVTQSTMARDAFSLIHFPMIFGIIAVAAALEQALAHPAEPFALDARLALAGGLALFVAGTAVAVRRARGDWMRPRLLVTAIMVLGLLALPATAPALALGVATLGIVLVAMTERRA